MRKTALAGIILLLAVVVAACGGSAPSTTVSTAASTSTTPTTSPTTTLAASTTEAVSTTSSSTTVSTEAATPGTFTATLSGKNEVPAVSSPGGGTLTLTFDSTGTKVKWELDVNDLADITLARLHEGKAGDTGGVIVTFYGGPTKTGPFSGTLAAGTFFAKSLAGPLEGKGLAELERLIESGDVYVNVGTTAHTHGEIRGQLEPAETGASQ